LAFADVHLRRHYAEFIPPASVVVRSFPRCFAG
jgi:hypothetical protein